MNHKSILPVEEHFLQAGAPSLISELILRKGKYQKNTFKRQARN